MNSTLESVSVNIVANQLKSEKDFWKTFLSDDFEKTCLPFDKNISKSSYNILKKRFVLLDVLKIKLLNISNLSDYNLFIILTAGVSLLLNKYTDSDDIIIGTPIFKQESISKLLNTSLVIRNKVDENKSFKQLIVNTNLIFKDIFKNQNYPLQFILQDLGFSKVGDEFPLFDIAIIFENLQYVEYIENTKPNVYFIFSKDDEEIAFTIKYNTSVLSEESVIRLYQHFESLLLQAVNNIELEVKYLKLLPDNRVDELLSNLNNNFFGFNTDLTIHKLFENQVEITPSSIAIVMDDKHITYSELNSKANQLSWILIERGITYNSIVGIITERSIEVIISLLAVMKAGGAYLPIDSNNPIERIKNIVEDSDMKFLIAQENWLSKINLYNLELINLPINPVIIKKSNPNLIIEHYNLAYVIYTSGSTGKPKGVAVEHTSVVNTLLYRKELYHKDKYEIELIIFPSSFDGFITSFFTPIISGSRVVLLSDLIIKDIEKICKIISKNQVTSFICIPSLFQNIIESISFQDAKSLNTIILAGEKLYQSLIRSALEKNNKIEIVNEYGVTEGAVCSTIYKHQEKDSTIKIGKPIGNTSIYILNKYNHLQDIGIPGELCVSGKGIARGYLNNSVLTNDKFILNPYKGNEILYKTGDIVKLLPDGNIELLGRRDSQIKIRGFRIEIGEIEMQLKKNEKIKDAVVILKSKNSRSNYLYAYIVSKCDISELDIRNYCNSVLPSYMIPDYIIFIDSVPLTTSGKVDKKALPDVKTNKNYALEKPRNQLEEKILEIWSNVLELKKDEIGINSNFFEIGGHSLNATRLINKIHKEMGVKIPVLNFFKSPTINDLASLFNNYEYSEYQGIPATIIRDFYNVSFAQKRMFLTQQKDIKSLAYNVPFQLIMDGKTDVKKLEECFSNLIKRHECLRTSFHVINEEFLQKIETDIKINIERFDAYEYEIDKLIKSFTKSFNLSEVPLIRFRVIYLTDVNKTLLMIDMHHIITDGTSIGILMNDFMKIYNNMELPELRIHYKDYAEWQCSKEYKVIIEKHEKYWEKIFSKKIERLKLPIDYERKNFTNHGKKIVYMNTDEDITNKIFKLASDNGTTFYCLVISIFSIFLSKLCKSNDIIIGSPATGRTHSDLESIVGYFVNTVVLRNIISEELSFNDFIKEVKINCYGALENQDYPFENLVQKYDANVEVDRSPIFDIFLNYNNFSFPLLQLDGVKLNHYYEIIENKAKFDLSLNVTDYENEVNFSFSYNSNLFSEKTMKWQASCFSSLMNSIVLNPELKIKEFDIAGRLSMERAINSVENLFDL